MGSAVMLSQDDKSLWKGKKPEECEWDNIDQKRCEQILKERRDKLIEENRMLRLISKPSIFKFKLVTKWNLLNYFHLSIRKLIPF